MTAMRPDRERRHRPQHERRASRPGPRPAARRAGVEHADGQHRCRPWCPRSRRLSRRLVLLARRPWRPTKRPMARRTSQLTTAATSDDQRRSTSGLAKTTSASSASQRAVGPLEHLAADEGGIGAARGLDRRAAQPGPSTVGPNLPASMPTATDRPPVLGSAAMAIQDDPAGRGTQRTRTSRPVRCRPCATSPLPPDSIGLPAEAQAARPAAAQRRARPPAARQAHRAGRVRVRQPLVERLRHRGDPPRPRAGGRPRWPSRWSCRSPIALLVMLGLLILSLPGDDQGVPVGRRRLPRHPRQLRHRPGPGRGRVAARRLHPHRGRVGVGRHRRADLRRSTRSARYRVPISLGFIVIVMYGNLRGVKESGKVFAVPTYFFMLNMALLLGVRPREVPRRRPRTRSAATTRASSTSGTPPRTPASTWAPAPYPARQGVRVGRRRRHRRRGHLQRRARLPGAGLEERPPDARAHGLPASA